MSAAQETGSQCARSASSGCACGSGMLRTSRAIEGELRERLRVAFSVTLPQFDVMAALARKPAGMTMTELSRLLMVSNGNVTGIIDRLAADELVTRQSAGR